MKPSEEQRSVADQLWRAERTLTAMPKITNTLPAFSEEDAYAVQMINVERALEEGRRLVGYKVGLTSRAAQKHFRVEKPDFGHLFSDMAIAEEGTVDLQTLIQPKIEGEIAFVLGRDLTGPGATVVDAMRAVEYAVAAMEIVDSRIVAWQIAAADTIADNGSSARFVLAGRKRKLAELDLPSVGMALSRNGEVMVTGAGSAVLGNPVAAVAFLANELGRHGRMLRAGDIVLGGSLSGMISMAEGDVYRCEMSDLGEMSVRVARRETKR